jgi:hypothetical protein
METQLAASYEEMQGFSAFHETCLTKENQYNYKQVHTSGVGYFEGDGEGSDVVGVSDGDGLGSDVVGETLGS